MDVKIDIPWDLFKEATERAASRAVRKTAFEVKLVSQNNIRGGVAAHVRKTKIGGKWEIETVTDLIDTGAMLNSGYVITGDGYNERPDAVQRAIGMQPGVPFGQPDTPPSSHLHARAAYAVEYAPYVEALYPFLRPAVTKVAPRAAGFFADELRKEGL